MEINQTYKGNNDYEKIIAKLAKQYNIKVVRYFKGGCGRAYYKEGLIRIPKKLDNMRKFLVALHEIGHLVEGKQKTSYMSEYVAMKWALKKFKELGMYDKGAEESERRYFTKKLCQAKNRRSKIEDLPDEVFKFSRLSKQWVKKANKIYLYGRGKGWLTGIYIKYETVTKEKTKYGGTLTTKNVIKRVELPDMFTLE